MSTKNELITALVENLNKADIPLPGELIVKNYETLGGITAEGYRYQVNISDKETGKPLTNHVFFDVDFKGNTSDFLDCLNILISYIRQYYVNQVHEVFSTQLQNAFDVLTNKKTNELFNVVVQTEPDAFDVETNRIRSKASIYDEVSGDEILTRSFAFDAKIIIRPDLPEHVNVDEIGLVSMYLAKETCNRIGYEFKDVPVGEIVKKQPSNGKTYSREIKMNENITDVVSTEFEAKLLTEISLRVVEGLKETVALPDNFAVEHYLKPSKLGSNLIVVTKLHGGEKHILEAFFNELKTVEDDDYFAVTKESLDSVSSDIVKDLVAYISVNFNGLLKRSSPFDRIPDVQNSDLYFSANEATNAGNLEKAYIELVCSSLKENMLGGILSHVHTEEIYNNGDFDLALDASIEVVEKEGGYKEYVATLKALCRDEETGKEWMAERKFIYARINQNQEVLINDNMQLQVEVIASLVDKHVTSL